MNAYIPAKWGYIDKKGEVVIELKYWWANPFEERLATVSLEEGGNRAVIDREGKIVIPQEYNSVTSFRNGLMRVTHGDSTAGGSLPGLPV